MADPGSEWVRLAAPLVLQEDLVPSRTYIASAVPDDSAAYQLGATKLARITIESWAKRLRLQVIVTDVTTQRNSSVLSAEPSEQPGLIPRLDALARKLDSAAIKFPTQKDGALQAFASATQATDVSARVRSLNDAVSIDPNFGLAYIALAEIGLSNGQNAQDVIARASPHRAKFSALDNARFEVIDARSSHAPITRQEAALEAVLRLAPNSSDLLANLASVHFLQNDFGGGELYIQRAIQLNPFNANLRKQLAEGLLATRRYADAEKAFAGLSNNPAILPELATCVLLEGDAARADSIFNRFLSTRGPNDPFTPLLHANWLALSGRRPQAISSLQNISWKDENLHAAALAEITIWELMENHTPEAAKSAAAAGRTGSPAGSIAVFLAQPATSPEQLRSQLPAAKTAGQILLGYALFLHRFYADAAATWKAVLDQSGGSDLRARAMLASSLDRSGQVTLSRDILVQPFAPELGDLYAAISFDELRRMRRPR